MRIAHYCTELLGRNYEEQCVAILYGMILRLLEDCFGRDENAAKRIILAKGNRELFRAVARAEGRLRFMDVATVAQKCGRRSELVVRQHETPSDLARKLRTVWGLGDQCIDNLVATLEAHGIFILTYNFGTDKIDGFHLASSDNEIVCIVIN